MKKVKTHKGYIIAYGATNLYPEGGYLVFTKDEWASGAGFRTEEWEAGSLEEAIDWIG